MEPDRSGVMTLICSIIRVLNGNGRCQRSVAPLTCPCSKLGLNSISGAAAGAHLSGWSTSELLINNNHVAHYSKWLTVHESQSSYQARTPHCFNRQWERMGGFSVMDVIKKLKMVYFLLYIMFYIVTLNLCLNDMVRDLCATPSEMTKL